MTTPAPAPAQLQGEPFSEALSEAAQAAAMSVRLILTIADAVRRASQKHHHGQEQDLPEDVGQIAESWWSADELGKHVPSSLLDHLTASPDWPVVSRQLISLSRAGVDLPTFLLNLGTMASGVERAVARNTARIQAEGTDRWAELLRTTIPEGLVRDAIIASPAWPDIAATMGRLHDRCVDVARILTDAHAAGLGVDQAIAAATTAAISPAACAPTPAAPAPAAGPTPAATPPAPAATSPAPAAAAPAPATAPTSAAPAAPAPTAPLRQKPDPWAASAPVTPVPAPPATPAPAPAAGQTPGPWAAPAVSADAKNLWGPLTEGLEIPRDLDLRDRAHALDQLGVTPGAHRTLVSRVNETLPQQEAAFLVSSRQWPVLAHRMHRMAQQNVPVAAHLARIAPDTATWRDGPPSSITARLLMATHHALTTPLDQPLPAGPRVSTTAARSRSTTTAPDTAPPKQPAPAEPAVPAHRQQTTPAPRQAVGGKRWAPRPRCGQ
ncbi:hypothetical protein [Streptomyces sp. NPDC006267]|uniref:hypothetical protein n=1 Tax=Streptomyces sp. NPDC006267 TaxID=3157173 RepID=UPI0033B1841F